jgi:glycosyltransferase involved in cell wall biosynthesis
MFDDAKPSQIKRNFVVQWVKDLITKQIDGLWLPSKDYDEAYEKFIDKNSIVFYGYNCIDNDLFRYKEKRSIDFTTVICVARLVPIKNIDYLLRAWKLIEKRRPNYRLVIIGDGPEFVNLNELTLNMGLKTIVFLGAVNNSDIPTYFYNSSAFVLPSLSESWGLVVNEAMASGLPLLISNKINAANTLLKEGVNGFGFEPSNVKSIAENIIRYIDLSLEDKRKMSQNSSSIISEMDYENMGEELICALSRSETVPNKKPSALASVLINRWHGRYNTSGWDKL